MTGSDFLEPVLAQPPRAIANESVVIRVKRGLIIYFFGMPPVKTAKAIGFL
jgi:hypothetical protein